MIYLEAQRNILERRGKQLWSLSGPRDSFRLEGWLVGTTILILQVFAAAKSIAIYSAHYVPGDPTEFDHWLDDLDDDPRARHKITIRVNDELVALIRETILKLRDSGYDVSEAHADDRARNLATALYGLSEEYR